MNAAPRGGDEGLFEETAPRSRSRARAVAGLLVAGACLACAAVLLFQRREDLHKAVGAITAASPLLLALALVLPLVNWAFSTATFWVLMRRAGRVGLLEMAALMGASWLANYMPLKPGLVGRMAYHRHVNGISYRDSGMAVVEAVGLSAVSAAVLLGVALLADPGRGGAWVLWVAGGVWVIACIWTAVHAGLRVHTDEPVHQVGRISTWSAALGMRLGDCAVWVWRYHVAFALVGAPITLTQAAALAAVGQAVAALPVVGSAIGVREWAVAILAAALPHAAGGEGNTGSSLLSSGLVADLVNRAIEIGLAIAVGLASSAWVARRIAVISPKGGANGASAAIPGPPGDGIPTIIGGSGMDAADDAGPR